MKDNEKFKEFLAKKDYNECIKIMENIISNYVVNLIKEKGINYEYTGFFDLVDASNKYLDGEERFIAEKIKFFSVEEDELEKLERLMELCATYNIKY